MMVIDSVGYEFSYMRCHNILLGSISISFSGKYQQTDHLFHKIPRLPETYQKWTNRTSKKMIETDCTCKGNKKQNVPKYFLRTDHTTMDGEAVEQSHSYIDPSMIEYEEKCLCSM